MTTKQRNAQNAAAAKREAKQAAHAAMMARHAERREAIKLHEAAWDAWCAADCVGPMPIHPDVLKERQEARAMERAYVARIDTALQMAGVIA